MTLDDRVSTKAVPFNSRLLRVVPSFGIHLERGRIHASKATADELKSFGKEAWLEKREDTVNAKGNGILETYWIAVSGERAASVNSVMSHTKSSLKSSGAPHGKGMEGLDETTRRLVNWNVETLLSLMKEMVARRSAHSTRSSKNAKSQQRKPSLKLAGTPLEEVREIIALPDFDIISSGKQQDPENVVIPQEVVTQLHHLVSCIASMYNANPFHKYVLFASHECICSPLSPTHAIPFHHLHSFSHASHVVMSVIKREFHARRIWYGLQS